MGARHDDDDGDDGDRDTVSEEDRAAELALCKEAAIGAPAAISELEARFFPEIARALRTLDRSGDARAPFRKSRRCIDM